MLVILLLGVVVLLVVVGAVMDLKARRRKVRYSVDPAEVRDHRRTADAELHMRSAQLRDGGFTGQF